MLSSLKRHWQEYLIEACGLGTFMISACAFGVLLFNPAVAPPIENDFLQRGLMGLAMGATAVLIICSPFGKRSGAHINPAVTLTFFRLGKIKGWDVVFISRRNSLAAVWAFISRGSRSENCSKIRR